MDSRHGSETPAWLHHAGPTMAARAWPRSSPRQLEDLRRPSASFGLSPSIWQLSVEWMRLPFGVGAIYQLEEHLGQRVAEPP
jgi:hypothetical protein